MNIVKMAMVLVEEVFILSVSSVDVHNISLFKMTNTQICVEDPMGKKHESLYVNVSSMYVGHPVPTL